MAGETLTFYTHPMSRGRIARWMLEEIGAPYETRVIDYGPAMKAADYRAVNPMGKVPALVHGDAVVTETAAILAYLADAFPEAGLAPAPGTPERGAYYRWLFFAAGPFEAAVTNAALGFEIGEDPRRRGMAGYGSLEAVLDTVEAAVSGRESLLGGGVSAADICLGAQIGFGLRFGSVPPRAAFAAYAGTLNARPAAKRAAEMDDVLLAAHPMPGG